MIRESCNRECKYFPQLSKKKKKKNTDRQVFVKVQSHVPPNHDLFTYLSILILTAFYTSQATLICQTACTLTKHRTKL